jgi:vacuolar-type H+-ATPase subunit D/Vma8
MAESAQVRIAKLDTATTQEARALAAMGQQIDAEVTKLDAYRAEMQGRFDRLVAADSAHETLQTIGDMTNRLTAAVNALTTATKPIAEQVARLTEMGRDPVPTDRSRNDG